MAPKQNQAAKKTEAPRAPKSTGAAAAASSDAKKSSGGRGRGRGGRGRGPAKRAPARKVDNVPPKCVFVKEVPAELKLADVAGVFKMAASVAPIKMIHVKNGTLAEFATNEEAVKAAGAEKIYGGVELVKFGGGIKSEEAQVDEAAVAAAYEPKVVHVSNINPQATVATVLAAVDKAIAKVPAAAAASKAQASAGSKVTKWVQASITTLLVECSSAKAAEALVGLKSLDAGAAGNVSLDVDTNKSPNLNHGNDRGDSEKVQMMGTPSAVLYIKNLPRGVKNTDLEDQLKAQKVITLGRGAALAEFKDAAAATAVISKQPVVIEKKEVLVKFSPKANLDKEEK